MITRIACQFSTNHSSCPGSSGQHRVARVAGCLRASERARAAPHSLRLTGQTLSSARSQEERGSGSLLLTSAQTCAASGQTGFLTSGGSDGGGTPMQTAVRPGRCRRNDGLLCEHSPIKLPPPPPTTLSTRTKMPVRSSDSLLLLVF